MVANVLSINEIVSDPQVRGGRPVIRGTGIRVSDVVAWHYSCDKLSLDQIARDFRLDLAPVYAAITYYLLHRAEIDAEMRRDTEYAERILAELEQQGRAKPLIVPED